MRLKVFKNTIILAINPPRYPNALEHDYIHVNITLGEGRKSTGALRHSVALIALKPCISIVLDIVFWCRHDTVTSSLFLFRVQHRSVYR